MTADFVITINHEITGMITISVGSTIVLSYSNYFLTHSYLHRGSSHSNIHHFTDLQFPSSSHHSHFCIEVAAQEILDLFCWKGCHKIGGIISWSALQYQCGPLIMSTSPSSFICTMLNGSFSAQYSIYFRSWCLLRQIFVSDPVYKTYAVWVTRHYFS